MPPAVPVLPAKSDELAAKFGWLRMLPQFEKTIQILSFARTVTAIIRICRDPLSEFLHQFTADDRSVECFTREKQTVAEIFRDGVQKFDEAFFILRIAAEIRQKQHPVIIIEFQAKDIILHPLLYQTASCRKEFGNFERNIPVHRPIFEQCGKKRGQFFYGAILKNLMSNQFFIVTINNLLMIPIGVKGTLIFQLMPLKLPDYDPVDFSR